jgi:hypothetical protein
MSHGICIIHQVSIKLSVGKGLFPVNGELAIFSAQLWSLADSKPDMRPQLGGAPAGS